MKRMIVFSCAALVASLAMAQQRPPDYAQQSRSDQYQNSHDRNDQNSHDRDHQNSRDRNHWSSPSRHQAHRWARGQRVPTQYRSSRYVVTNYSQYHLRRPPRGYHWVRDDNGNYLLVAITSGIIADLLLHSQ